MIERIGLRKFLASQERVVLVVTLLLFFGFALFLPVFLSSGNLIALLRSVSVLGMLSLGMAIVVIARGVDVAMVATMVVSVAWMLVLTRSGLPLWVAFLLGGVGAVAFGALVGAIVAFGEIPAIFGTLAAGAVIYGFGRTWLFQLEMQNVPPGNPIFEFIGQGTSFGIPNGIILFAVLALVVHLLLSRTRFGATLYAIGVNPSAARVSGFAIRPTLVKVYAISAGISFLSGLLLAAGSNSINVRLYNSTMIYDILLIVVLGGIGLSGGHGRVRNVLLGTLLVGILLNGMTILNVNYTMQNLAKGIVLLIAITADALLNPRDEQTSKQGDL